MPKLRKGLRVQAHPAKSKRHHQVAFVEDAAPVMDTPEAEAQPVVPATPNTNNPNKIGLAMALTAALTVATVVLCLTLITNPFLAVSLSITAGVTLIGGWIGYFVALRSNDLHNVLMSTQGAVEDVRDTIRETKAQIQPFTNRAANVIKQAEGVIAKAKKEVPQTARGVRRILQSISDAIMEGGALVAKVRKQVKPLAKSTQGVINAVHGTVNKGKKVLGSAQGAVDKVSAQVEPLAQSAKGILDATKTEIPVLSAVAKQAIAGVAQTTCETIEGNAPKGLVKAAASSVYASTIGRLFAKKEESKLAVIEEEKKEEHVELTRTATPVLVEQQSDDEFVDAQERPDDGLNARQRQRQREKARTLSN